VWLQQHVALDVGSLRIPVPWYQSIDPLFSIFGVPLLFWIWHQQASRRREPGELAKFGIGAWLAAASNLILVVAILAAGSARVHPIWPFLYCAGQGSLSFTTGPRCWRWPRGQRPRRSTRP
jgi:POT family proton-dependent oligopeptide transporter